MMKKTLSSLLLPFLFSQFGYDRQALKSWELAGYAPAVKFRPEPARQTLCLFCPQEVAQM